MFVRSQDLIGSCALAVIAALKREAMQEDELIQVAAKVSPFALFFDSHTLPMHKQFLYTSAFPELSAHISDLFLHEPAKRFSVAR